MGGGRGEEGFLLEFGINSDGDGHACLAELAFLVCPLSFPEEGSSCNYAWCSHAARQRGQSPHTLCLRMPSHKTWSMCNYAIRPIPGPDAQLKNGGMTMTELELTMVAVDNVVVHMLISSHELDGPCVSIGAASIDLEDAASEGAASMPAPLGVAVGIGRADAADDSSGVGGSSQEEVVDNDICGFSGFTTTVLLLSMVVIDNGIVKMLMFSHSLDGPCVSIGAASMPASPGVAVGIGGADAADEAAGSPAGVVCAL